MDDPVVIEARATTVGALGVRRALPARGRRTVGAWCFADHMGPAELDAERGAGIAPHPHAGLQTVTWLFDGEVVHRDSLGTEQPIVPGQLNLMTAGAGVAHAEESPPGASTRLHGIQLWVAQPDATRGADPAFEHHGELPRAELDSGELTVLVGELAGVSSPARRDTDHVAAELSVRAGSSALGVDRDHEHALVVVDGEVEVEGTAVVPGQLCYLGVGREELAIAARRRARAMLLGGAPFTEELVMWWNYVARSRDEVLAAHRSWTRDDGRFGTVDSALPRVVVDPPAWAIPER